MCWVLYVKLGKSYFQVCFIDSKLKVVHFLLNVNIAESVIKTVNIKCVGE